MDHGPRKFNGDRNVLSLSDSQTSDVQREVYKNGVMGVRVYVLLIHSCRGYHSVYVGLLTLLYERDTQVMA